MNLTPPNIYLLDTVIEKKELLQRANIALNFLTNKSLPPGSFILVDASVGVDIFPWFLACITKQYCLVPISSFAAKNKEQLAYYFSLFKKNVFIDSTFSLKPVSSLEEEIILPALKDVPNNFWATIMSSGSTGAQKAVVLTKENFLASAMAHAKHHGNFGLWLNALPLYHVGGLSVFTRALLLGQDIAYTEKFSPDLLVRWIDAHPITHTSMVPTMLYKCLQNKDCMESLRGLRAILLGGAAADEDLLRRAKKEKINVLTTYGLTESCSQVVTAPYEADFCTAAGVPLEGVSLKINESQEICISGKMLSPGYWQEEQKISSLPLREGYFPTGDLGEIDAAGGVKVLGRKDDLIVSGGINIYPAEVESAISSLPHVAGVVVLGLKDSEWGQRLVSAVEWDYSKNCPEKKMSVDELREYLRQKIDSRKIPKEFLFVTELPRTESQKIIRHKVVELFKKN